MLFSDVQTAFKHFLENMAAVMCLHANKSDQIHFPYI